MPNEEIQPDREKIRPPGNFVSPEALQRLIQANNVIPSLDGYDYIPCRDEQRKRQLANMIVHERVSVPYFVKAAGQ